MGACAWQERSGQFWSGRERRDRSAENQDPEEEAAWKSQVRAWRKSLGVGTAVKPLDAMRLQIRGLPNMNDRIRALLNMVILHHGMDGPQDHLSLKASVKGIIVDVSQNPGRRPFTNKDGLHRTLTTSSLQVHLGKRRIVTPREMMFQQGYPTSMIVPEGMSQAALKKLAGEGMALPCLGLCLWCVFLLKGFPEG